MSIFSNASTEPDLEGPEVNAQWLAFWALAMPEAWKRFRTDVVPEALVAFGVTALGAIFGPGSTGYSVLQSGIAALAAGLLLCGALQILGAFRRAPARKKRTIQSELNYVCRVLFEHTDKTISLYDGRASKQRGQQAHLPFKECVRNLAPRLNDGIRVDEFVAVFRLANYNATHPSAVHDADEAERYQVVCCGLFRQMLHETHLATFTWDDSRGVQLTPLGWMYCTKELHVDMQRSKVPNLDRFARTDEAPI